MNPLFSVEYRGYTTYEIDNLVNTGQARMRIPGPLAGSKPFGLDAWAQSPRQCAYSWIDNYFDGTGPGFLNGQYYAKPASSVRERLIIQNEALHASRLARDQMEAQRRAEFDKDH
jgi:hypothetical protein